MEATSALLMTLGIALLLASWLLLLVESSNEDFAWGLCTLLLPPLSYAYGLLRLDRAGESLALAGAGWLLIFLAW
jgi:hypothetical protein